MTAPVAPGDVLAGKYRVDRVLGEGAMGVVVAATHVELGSRVALKFMLPAAVRGEEGIQRFMREAKAAGKLTSEHVCRVLDVGRLENQAPYIVMEYLEGRDFAALLAERRILPGPMAAAYMIQVCEAMAEAHAAGIVHRDLKPQNLFVARKRSGADTIKVLDFGISKAQGTGDLAATSTGALMGSPAYMSPEQVKSSKHVDARSDLWAMGVILYQAVTGRLPFVGEEVYSLITAIVTEPPPAPRMLRPDLSPDLEAIILRCLEKEKERRFGSAEELAAALAPHAQGASMGRVITPPPMMAFDATRAPAGMATPTRPGSQAGLGHVAETVAPAVGAVSAPLPATSSAPLAVPSGITKSTLGGAAAESFAAPTAARPKRGMLFAGAGVAIAAGVSVAVLLAGGGGGGGTPAAAPGPSLVDEGKPAAAALDAAPVAAAEPPPVAPPPVTTPDAGVAVAVEDKKPERDKKKPPRDKKPPPVEEKKPPPVEVKLPPPPPPDEIKKPPPDEIKKLPPPPVEEKKVEEKKKPPPREEDEFSN